MRLIEMGPKFLQKHMTLQNSPSLQTITVPNLYQVPRSWLVALRTWSLWVATSSIILLQLCWICRTAFWQHAAHPAHPLCWTATCCFRNLKMSSCTRIHTWYIPCTARAGLNLEAFRSPSKMPHKFWTYSWGTYQHWPLRGLANIAPTRFGRYIEQVIQVIQSW